MESGDVGTETKSPAFVQAGTSRRGWGYWLGGWVLGAVLALMFSRLLQLPILEPDTNGTRYRFGLWEIGWASIFWMLGTILATIATAQVLFKAVGLIGFAWIRWLLGAPLYLGVVAGALLMFGFGALLGVTALIEAPTMLNAHDGQRVYAELDYDQNISAVRVRASMFGYVLVQVPGAPGPQECLLDAQGQRLALVCGGERVELK